MTNKELKDLKSKMNKVLNEVQQIIDTIGDNDLQDNQLTLDFCDKLMNYLLLINKYLGMDIY